MRFTWDPAKARANRLKQGVTFELAVGVWDDPLHVIVPDRVVDGEERWHAIGMIGAVTLTLVVHVYLGDEDQIRIVGARKATAHERRRYEQEGA